MKFNYQEFYRMYFYNLISIFHIFFETKSKHNILSYASYILKLYLNFPILTFINF